MFLRYQILEVIILCLVGLMTRAAYYDFTIGDKTLAELNIRHLIDRITFTEELGKFDSVEIELQQGPELKNAYKLLKHGAVFQLSLGYYNETIKPMTLGFIKGVGVSCSERTATINIFGYLGALSKGEKQRVLQNRTIRQVVEEIVSDYDPLVVGTIENGDTLINETSSQSNQSDLEYLENIAKQFGMRWKTEPTETKGIWALSLYSMASGSEEMADILPTVVFNPYKTQQTRSNYRHLKTFDVESNIMGLSSSVTILSNNPNQPISVDSDLYDPTIYQSEVSGSRIVYEVFGSVNQISFYENVDNEEAASIISNSLLSENELQFVSSKNAELAEGDCEFRSGQYRNIILNDIPLFGDVFSGRYLVTKTQHTIGKDDSYSTRFDSNRSSLTPPPPPEIPTGGSGGGGFSGDNGYRYRLMFDSNGLVGGYRIHLDPNVSGGVILDSYLSPAEILAIPYLANQVAMHYTPAFQLTQTEAGFQQIGFPNGAYYTPANAVDPNTEYAPDFQFAVQPQPLVNPVYDPLGTLQYSSDSLHGRNTLIVEDVNVPEEYGDGTLYQNVRNTGVGVLEQIRAGNIDDLVTTYEEELEAERLERLEAHELAVEDDLARRRAMRKAMMASMDSGNPDELLREIRN